MTEATVYQLDDYRNRPSPEEQRTKHLQARLAQIGIDIIKGRAGLLLLESERDRIIRILGEPM